jgi:UDP-3-O-[3-hydroxymyristoyl] glucosamine N-acyltransferase
MIEQASWKDCMKLRAANGTPLPQRTPGLKLGNFLFLHGSAQSRVDALTVYRTIVEDAVLVEQGATMADTVLGRGAQIGSDVACQSAILEGEAVIERGARLGPRAYVGAGSVVEFQADLHFRVRVGARARIGQRTRVGEDTYLGDGVSIGADCAIGRRVFIGDRCIIGDHVRIGDDTHVVDSTIADGARISSRVQITATTVGRARLGRWCQVERSVIGRCELAPGVRVIQSEVEDGARVAMNGKTLWSYVKRGARIGERAAIYRSVVGARAQIAAQIIGPDVRVEDDVRLPDQIAVGPGMSYANVVVDGQPYTIICHAGGTFVVARELLLKIGDDEEYSFELAVAILKEFKL